MRLHLTFLSVALGLGFIQFAPKLLNDKRKTQYSIIHSREEKCMIQNPINIPYEIVTAKFGQMSFQMAIYQKTPTSSDVVSNHIRERGEWAGANTKAILNALNLDKSSSFVDIGANIGWFSLVLALHGKRVYAVEPFESNLQLMKMSICLNPQISDNLVVIPFGLSTSKTTCKLYQDPTVNHGDALAVCDDTKSGKKRAKFIEIGTMETTTLDFLVESGSVEINEHTVMKIDTEGYEPFVMMGGEQTMTKTPPRLIMSEYCPQLINWHHTDDSFALKYLETMTSYGYRVRFQGNEITDIKKMAMANGNKDIWFVHDSSEYIAL